MKFDITNIDKVKLLKALYGYTDPTVGVGGAEFITRKARGENVSELSDLECAIALSEFNESTASDSFKIFDYHNGKPMKVVFYRSTSGRVLVSSNHYDERNGKYRFLEAMISCFPKKDILIVDKSTPRSVDKNDNSSKERKNHFRSFLHNAKKESNEFGFYWKIDD